VPLLLLSKARRPKATLQAGRFERELQQYLYTELRRLRAAVPMDELASVLAAAKESEVFALVDVAATKGVFVGMDDYLIRGAAAGAKGAAEQLGRVATLDPARARLKRWVKEHTGELVKQTVGTSKDAIRTTLREGIAAGRHPRRLAEDVRTSLGLTERDAGAVAKRRATLLEKLPPERANSLADAYGDKLLKKRAQVIAGNEAHAAVNAGRCELWNQLVEDGALPAGQIQEWDAANDLARCKVCNAMHKQPRPIGTDFEAPDGRKVSAPPLHVSCRCTVLLRDK
jgi:hypothetical protein